jgi:hypothetical protein
MPSNAVAYQLQDGFISNWLVAGPQMIAVDLSSFPGDDFRRGIIRHYREAESGISDTPVERGPIDAGRFQVGAFSGSWSYYACPEDHAVDHSGSFPLCQYLRSWAYAELTSDTAQAVTLALSTYGPADVWLDGEHVFRGEQLGEQPLVQTFEAMLKEGTTPLLVRFEGVGVRETAHAMALRICRPGSGEALAPAQGVSAGFHTLMPDLGRRNAFELLSGAAFLEREVYEGETPIILRWPEGSQAPCPAHVRLQTVGGSIYALADVAGAPGDQLNLGYPIQIPAGPFRVTLMPSPEEVHVQHMRLFHHLPLWSMGRQRYSPSSTDDLAKRRGDALLAAAQVQGSPLAQIARMALGAWADVEPRSLHGAIEQINRREEGSILLLLGLIGMLERWGERPEFPAELRQPLEDCALRFRYAEEGQRHDSMDLRSEGGSILSHTATILAGQRYPERIFADGQTGAWHRARGERLALAWMARVGAYGSADWDSPATMSLELAALSHLCDLAEDQQVYELATVLIDKLLFTLALNSSRGILATPYRDGGAHFVKSGLLQPTAGIARLMWGAGIYNHHLAGALGLACASGYELPPIIAAIAADTPAELWSLQRYAPPGQPSANIATYKTPEYVLSSVQDYLPGEPGQEEQVWRATLGAEAIVFANHPGSSSESDGRSPGFWSGNGRLPRVAQWKDVLVAVHRLSGGAFDFTHAYFPAAAFDEHVLRNGWAFARSGDGYLALTNSQGLHMVAQGRYAQRELRAHGAEQIWLLQLGRAEQDGDFAAFQARVLAMAVRFGDGGVDLVTLRGDRVRFGWEGPFTVNEDARPLAGFPHFENSYARADLPGHRMEIRHGGEGLDLDFTARDTV